MITGYKVRLCSFCGAMQPFLHLHTEKPCFVRCGRCGAQGPRSETPDEAVEAWNSHIDDVANGTSQCVEEATEMSVAASNATLAAGGRGLAEAEVE